MDYISGLPLELLDEIAHDNLAYQALLIVPVFARSLTIGRRFDFMVKFGYDFHVWQGNNEWRNRFTKNGKYHRVDGPAKEYANGGKFWYSNGKLHRIDGPAIEWSDGDKEWYINGKIHRLDGPAIEKAKGIKYWGINGKTYTEKKYDKIIANINKN